MALEYGVMQKYSSLNDSKLLSSRDAGPQQCWNLGAGTPPTTQQATCQ
jgi:hypothetical protein